MDDRSRHFYYRVVAENDKGEFKYNSFPAKNATEALDAVLDSYVNTESPMPDYLLVQKLASWVMT